MRLQLSALIILIAINTASPAAAVRRDTIDVNCAPYTKGETSQSSGGSTLPVAAVSAQSHGECATDNGPVQADLQIYGLFIIGMLIIGIPAVRRRQGRVVFS